MRVEEEARGASGPLWFVAHTKPRQERAAVENLLRQGYQTYLPRLKVVKPIRREHRVGLEPMFPRYLFFKPGRAGQSIGPVRCTHGVSSIVRFGGVAAVIRSRTVEEIQAFEHRQNTVDFAELNTVYVGKTVVVTAGPLAGLNGLVAMVSDQRVTVLMRLLGEDTRVRFDPCELRVAA